MISLFAFSDPSSEFVRSEQKTLQIMKLLFSFYALSAASSDPSGPRARPTCQDFKVEKNVDYPGSHYLPISSNVINASKYNSKQHLRE